MPADDPDDPDVGLAATRPPPVTAGSARTGLAVEQTLAAGSARRDPAVEETLAAGSARRDPAVEETLAAGSARKNPGVEDTLAAGSAPSHPALDHTAIAAGTPSPLTKATSIGAGSSGAAMKIPDRVGRFSIIKQLGAGGMGVVYAAYDAELDRKVAVKLVRADLQDEATRAAMLREAKAMAKVEHPNVITVFDVGTVDDQVFVAMELIAGGDLRAWMTAEKRDWRTLLRTCIQAGEGLAAAHRAGLVHRDFKPDNVLVGSDGRVRVTDFGLARHERIVDEPVEAPARAPTPDPSLRLSRTGAIIGTPAYMAPEQHKGERADARADQFAFCVTVWEALFGERPFEGTTYTTLALNVTEGNVKEPPKSDVPVRIKTALRRGISVDTSARFPSMDELLAQLSIDGSKKIWIAAAGIALVAAVGVTWAVTRSTATDGASCPTAESKLAGTWDSAQRAKVTAALTAAGPFGPDVAKQTSQALDTYARRWSASWADACATRGEQSQSLFDLRVGCLSERLAGLRATVQSLGSADAKLALAASKLVGTLPMISVCDDDDALRTVMPPPDQAVQVELITAKLIQMRVMSAQGKIEQAKAMVEEAVNDATKLGYKPMIARALYGRAQLLVESGDLAAAETTLQKVGSDALAVKDDDLAAEAYVDLVNVVGYELGRAAEAHRIAPIATGAIERAHDSPGIRIRFATTLARIYVREGKHDEAMAELEKLPALVAKVPENAREEAETDAVAVRSYIMFELGKFDEARVAIDKELELRAKSDGEKHPNYAIPLATRASLEMVANQWDAAVADLKKGREIIVNALGPDSVQLSQIEANLGIVAGVFGDWAESLRASQVAATLAEKAGGPEHPDTIKARTNIASALRELGKLDESEREFLAVAPIRERVQGADHVDNGIALYELGDLRLAQKRYDDAIATYKKSIDIIIKAVGEDHPLLTYAGSGLGRALLAKGDASKADSVLTAVLEVLTANEIDPVLRAKTRLAHAECKWKLGDRATAKQLAASAATDLDVLPKGTNAELHAQIATWLAAHEG